MKRFGDKDVRGKQHTQGGDRKVMRKKHLLVSGIMAFAAVFIAAGIYATTTMPDVIKLEDPAYKEHKKGEVVFNHKKHAVVFFWLFSLGLWISSAFRLSSLQLPLAFQP